MNRKTRAAYRQLSQMSDRMLADIGLTRADIPARMADHKSPFTLY